MPTNSTREGNTKVVSVRGGKVPNKERLLVCVYRYNHLYLVVKYKKFCTLQYWQPKDNLLYVGVSTFAVYGLIVSDSAYSTVKKTSFSFRVLPSFI